MGWGRNMAVLPVNVNAPPGRPGGPIDRGPGGLLMEFMPDHAFGHSCQALIYARELEREIERLTRDDRAAQGEHVEAAVRSCKWVLTGQWMPGEDMEVIDRIIAKRALTIGPGNSKHHYFAWVDVAVSALLAAGHCHEELIPSEAEGEKGGE